MVAQLGQLNNGQFLLSDMNSNVRKTKKKPVGPFMHSPELQTTCNLSGNLFEFKSLDCQQFKLSLHTGSMTTMCPSSFYHNMQLLSAISIP
jgi:hypothetical protein